MSSRNFKFVSPGVFLNEIDQSKLPSEPQETGPVIIGRTLRGPAMRPVRVDSFAEFVEMFGEPQPGGKGDDIWRNGNTLTPTYASYAAQAWLKNSPTCTIVRLLGKHHLNKTANGKAGWKTDQSLIAAGDSYTDQGGAFGLFVFPGGISGSGGSIGTITNSGSLAAIWYCNEGVVGLAGQDLGGAEKSFGIAELIGSDASGNFKAVVTSSGATDTIKFNFSNGNKNFVRKVFNTNPTLVNSDITSTTKTYWLGETFENEFSGALSSSGPGDFHANVDPVPQYWGCIVGLGANTGGIVTKQHSSRLISNQDGQTGWFIAQDLGSDLTNYNPSNMQNLFKFHGRNYGEWLQNNLKISIANLKYSTNEFNKYGSFDVLIRNINDTDKTPVIRERFSNCNLNPNSENYIARRIGDAYVEFDTTERRLTEKGQYFNRSKYVRVEVNVDVDAGGTNEELLPFGVKGPLKYKNFSWTSGSTSFVAAASTFALAGGASGILSPVNPSSHEISASSLPDSTRFDFLYPSMSLRQTALQDNLGSFKQAYFGAWTGISNTNAKFNEGVRDLVAAKATDIDDFAAGTYTEAMWNFSLDNVSGSSTVGDFEYLPKGRLRGTSVTAFNGSYRDLLDAGINKFTTVFHGGSDGFDVTEKEPLRSGLLTDGTEKTNYEFNTYKEAIDLIKDPEAVEFNLALAPGLSHEGLTGHLVDTVEARADALAIIDLNGDFSPAYEGKTGPTYRTSVDTTVANLRNRRLNSSYGCAYYPWVQIRDTIDGSYVFMPPSVVALGAMSYTDRVKAPWFAPAGFNRGGLTSGVSGLPVVNVTQKLTSKDRDKLYDANINPIASFPSEGIVIFGQKTLQVTRSALDRINVRRLMLFVKKGISRISSDILFEPNVKETWDRFTARAEPFLQDVKARFGLTDYKLILDETTTTPDLIDRNIMYAKVFLKPARAIEFIAVDFFITNTGASFED